MATINFNIGSLTDKAKEFAISSKDFIIDTATSCALTTYEYGQDKLEAARLKIMPYVPSMIETAEIAGAVVIGGVALRALVNVSTHLPVVDTIAASVVAGYALTHPNECAQAVALYAIGSVAVKTLALSTCSLPMMQAFALYVGALAVVDYMTKVENRS